MFSKKIRWYKIADAKTAIKWQSNNMTVAEVAGKKITLISLEKGISACAYKCPHAGGIMADGFVDSLDNIVCPLHRYKFNLVNGRNLSGEGYHLKTFAVEERVDGVFIGLEEESIFNLLG